MTEIRKGIEGQGTEGLDDTHEEQHAQAADTTGQMAVGKEVELGSHEYYVDAYAQMDWTPEVEMVR